MADVALELGLVLAVVVLYLAHLSLQSDGMLAPVACVAIYERVTESRRSGSPTG